MTGAWNLLQDSRVKEDRARRVTSLSRTGTDGGPYG